MRPLLQGILQIAVAELHYERGNLRGATILMGEGLGRLQGDLEGGLGLDLDSLRRQVGQRLQALQQQRPLQSLDLPYLAVKVQA
jgi:predicted metal-dependent hydrolase